MTCGKIMLIGNNGQLGWELHRTCATLGEIFALDFPEIDLSQPNKLLELIREYQPNIIINAAAYTDVDKAESEPDLVYRINAAAPALLAKEARRLGAALIHYSTDFVFDGTKNNPYIESDKPNPLNIYGASKLEGEQAILSIGGQFLIFRSSWIFSMRQSGFVKKVLHWARQKEELHVVDDQIGSPTWARMLAEATAQVIAQGRNDIVEYIRDKTGLYHVAGKGAVSRFDWAIKILELDPKKEDQIVKTLLPAKTVDFLTPAIRPRFSTLDCTLFQQAFNIALPEWFSSLKLSMY